MVGSIHSGTFSSPIAGINKPILPFFLLLELVLLAFCGSHPPLVVIISRPDSDRAGGGRKDAIERVNEAKSSLSTRRSLTYAPE